HAALESTIGYDENTPTPSSSDPVQELPLNAPGGQCVKKTPCQFSPVSAFNSLMYVLNCDWWPSSMTRIRGRGLGDSALSIAVRACAADESFTWMFH